MIKLDQMVLKVVNWVHIQKSGHMVLKGVIWFEMSDLGTQYKHQVKWSLKESIVYTITKLGQMVLKGVNWVHNDKLGHIVLKGVICVHNVKIRSNGLDMSRLGKQYKNQVIWS